MKGKLLRSLAAALCLACLLLPVKAFGGPGKPERPVLRPEEAFEGSGTVEDPYLISDAGDFMLLTDGFNASTEKYVDMLSAGIVDPTKVTRSALQNAASIASIVLTTEALVVDINEPAPAAPAGGMGGGMDGMY